MQLPPHNVNCYLDTVIATCTKGRVVTTPEYCCSDIGVSWDFDGTPCVVR